MPDQQSPFQDLIFPGKRTDEEIILLLRRHWIILVINFFIPLFFLVAIGFFHFFGKSMLGYVGLYSNIAVANLIESFLFLFFWLIATVVWLDYYLDTWILTNERLVDITQDGLFRRKISELEYSKIQDVTSEVKGLIPTLLNYGTVYVQTAGEKANFEFKQIPNPVRVKAIIMELQKTVLLKEKKIEGAILRGKL